MVIITGYLYRNLAYQNQREAITELISLKVTNILEELSNTSRNLGMELQTDYNLREAIKENNLSVISRLFDTQFHRYFVTSGKLKLKDIYVFDENFKFIINSSKTNISTPALGLSCSNMIAIANKRIGAERLKPMSLLCTKNHESLFGVLVPVGTLKPFAYILVISDPAYSVIQLEQTLGEPIKILRHNGDVVYRSQGWPTDEKSADYLIASHVLRDPNGTTILKTFAARDIEPYRAQLFQLTLTVIVISIVIFAIVVSAVVYSLRTFLKPLDDLQSGALHLSKGEHVHVPRTPIPEIDVVIQAFNQMADNITELIKKLKTEILERKKTEQTLKKNQYDLSLARDQAYAASRTKSAFLANMSHELRTPLNAIIGYSEMLHDDAENSNSIQQVKDLKKIKTAGQHLLSVIDNILDLSKVEAGEIQLDVSNIGVKQLVDEVGTAVQSIVKKNNNALIVNCPAHIGDIHTDSVKLRQSILNILSNACKFTHNGQILLTVETEKRNDEDWVRFVISDTGIGISEEQGRKLFSEFTQADSSPTRNYEGTGIGLALSQRYCEILGGHITFTSELGKGSVFTISIPQRTIRETEINFDSDLDPKPILPRSA